MSHRFLKRARARSGAAVVEAAITLPVIFAIVLGTVEVCNAVFLQQSLEVIAYEGARVAVTPDATAEDIEHQVKLIAKNRKVDLRQITVEPKNFAAAKTGSFIKVSVVGNGSSSSSFFGKGTLESEVSMMKNY